MYRDQRVTKALLLSGGFDMPLRGYSTTGIGKTKTSRGNIPWLVGDEYRRLCGGNASGDEERLFQLNKNATDMGTSVAVVKLNQKIWLNCCAETRPSRYRKQ